jgi:light-regulated signal transduction histidine kinase (bacteriophytochrome)
MAQFPDVNHDPQLNLKTIKLATQEIFDVIDTVIAMAYFEREGWQRSLSLMALDLAPILDRHLSHVRERIEYDNAMFRSHRELAKNSPNFIIGHDIIATDLVINIPEIVPPIQGDERMLDQTIDILSRIAVKHPLKREVRIEVSFDGSYVSVLISWTGSGREEHLLDMFRQFETARTGFAFSERGLGLYLCWQMTRLQGGQLQFGIRDQASHHITMTLLRAGQ